MSENEHKGYRQEPKPLTDDEKRTLTQLDLDRGSKDGPGRLGCLLRACIGLAIIVSPIVAFLVIRPWKTVSEQVPTTSQLCTDDERAMQFRERFYVLGFEVSDKRKGVVCLSAEK